jgi:wyosine [tRNA(Phe)-imidazoG37] synthetase (radical SAM superfamily)
MIIGKYVFGPVVSRRLGQSLGVDIVPAKTCSLNCIYCEVGKTTRLTLDRREYTPASEVVDEVAEALTCVGEIDFITFSGSGEPALHSSIGVMIRELKKITSIPIAVLTNGTMLYEPEVRRGLMEADVVLPSLDAATPAVFQRINRPHPGLDFQRMIEGLVQFSNEYAGKLWVEILFVRNVNDSPGQVRRMKEILRRVKADKVQIHTVTRSPAEDIARPVSLDFLRRTAHLIGGRSEVLWASSSAHRGGERSAGSEIVRTSVHEGQHED